MKDDSVFLTARQVRAGRALLAWSQQDLAKKAGIAASTLADFERGQRKPMPNNAQAIRGALENAGISFPPGGAVVGPLLPSLGPIGKSGSPIRWVDLTDLSQWAERRDGQGALPTLLSKLVRATGRISVHFPSDEAIQFSGWDGITVAEIGDEYVPNGSCGWEIGTQREKIDSKANSDYEKRTTDSEHLIKSDSTFIFVTPRPWPNKEKWVGEKKAEKIWADVRAYDGTDLVHWIETYPSVGRWLATYLGKRPLGTLELGEIWQEWSLATELPLTTDLILSDRDQNSAAILSWLRSPPASMFLQGDTAEEICAFLYATINQLPTEIAEHYIARCLVASTPDMARMLADSISPLIIVLLDLQPGLAQAIAQKGHHVLCAYGSNTQVINVQRLERPTREGIDAALQSANLPREDAERFARESSRSLAVLRRLMANQTGSAPQWALSAPPKALLAAMLAGGWEDDSDADREILTRLGAAPYPALISEIVQYSGQLDSPIRKVGRAWKIASPQDAWLLLARYLTSADIDYFEAAAVDVLCSADPRYTMSPNERWLAPIRNVKPEYSEALRKGLSETLIMLALFGGHAHTDADAVSRPARIVGKVLDNADGQRWWSLCREFQLLAEAAPQQFLREIEQSLDQDVPPISALFGNDSDGVFSTEHLSDLLWALESLAWAPENLGRVSDVLARLDAIDPGGRYGNRPGSSLRNLYLLWLPQTYATQTQRFRVLDRLRKNHSEQSWKLMRAVLPNGYDSISPAVTTRWRDYKQVNVELITYTLIGQGTNELVRRLLEDVGSNVERWKQLLDRLSDIPEADILNLISHLSDAATQITEELDRTELWNHLRKILTHHRKFPDAEWALPESQIAALDAVYQALCPTGPLDRVRWLFGHGVELVNSATDWEKNDEVVGEKRSLESMLLLTAYGIDALFELAEIVQDPASIGRSIVRAGINDQELSILIKRGLHSLSPQHRWMAQGAIGSYVKEIPDRWFEMLLEKSIKDGWSQDAVLFMLQTLIINSWTWTLARDAGPEIELAFWQQASNYRINCESSENSFAVKKLIEVGRVHEAVHFIGTKKRFESIAVDFLIHVLEQAASQPLESGGDHNDPTMFQYHLVEILKFLDSAIGLQPTKLLALELAYLPLLEHSKRPPTLIPKAMAENPELFIQIICAIFKPSEESGIIDEALQDPDRAKNAATQAFHILSLWDVVPGTLPDGKIDAIALESWVKRARKLAKVKGRDWIADQKIGEVLSASPVGEDGIWPALEIRELIESVRSEPLEVGFGIGHRNRRGVTSRLLRDGGTQERDLAKRYDAYSKATALEWHRTSAVLADIARGYEVDARVHDESVEKLDW